MIIPLDMGKKSIFWPWRIWRYLWSIFPFRRSPALRCPTRNWASLSRDGSIYFGLSFFYTMWTVKPTLKLVDPDVVVTSTPHKIIRISSSPKNQLAPTTSPNCCGFLGLYSYITLRLSSLFSIGMFHSKPSHLGVPPSGAGISRATRRRRELLRHQEIPAIQRGPPVPQLPKGLALAFGSQGFFRSGASGFTTCIEMFIEI